MALQTSAHAESDLYEKRKLAWRAAIIADREEWAGKGFVTVTATHQRQPSPLSKRQRNVTPGRSTSLRASAHAGVDLHEKLKQAWQNAIIADEEEWAGAETATPQRRPMDTPSPLSKRQRNVTPGSRMSLRASAHAGADLYERRKQAWQNAIIANEEELAGKDFVTATPQRPPGMQPVRAQRRQRHGANGTAPEPREGAQEPCSIDVRQLADCTRNKAALGRCQASLANKLAILWAVLLLATFCMEAYWTRLLAIMLGMGAGLVLTAIRARTMMMMTNF